jgi:hypothetical protein
MRKLGQSTIERILARHRIRRISAKELQGTLCARPFPLAPGVRGVVRHILALLPQLKLLLEQLKQSERRLDRLLQPLRPEEP